MLEPLSESERQGLIAYLVRMGFGTGEATHIVGLSDFSLLAEGEAADGEPCDKGREAGSPADWEDPDCFRGAFRGAVSSEFIEDTHQLLQDHRRALNLSRWDFETPNRVLHRFNPRGHKNGGRNSAAAIDRARETWAKTKDARLDSVREFLANVGAKLKHARKLRGFSITALSQHIGIHAVNLRQIEAGTRGRFQQRTIQKLKAFLQECEHEQSTEAKAAD